MKASQRPSAGGRRERRVYRRVLRVEAKQAGGAAKEGKIVGKNWKWKTKVEFQGNQRKKWAKKKGSSVGDTCTYGKGAKGGWVGGGGGGGGGESGGLGKFTGLEKGSFRGGEEKIRSAGKKIPPSVERKAVHSYTGGRKPTTIEGGAPGLSIL